MTAPVLRWIAYLILTCTAITAGIQLSSSTWSSVQGTVLLGSWLSERSLYGNEKGYEVRYTYDVNGHTYTGTRIGWAAKTSIIVVRKDGDTKAEERQPREGDKVSVFYAPWAPSLAVLVPGPSPRVWIWSLVAALFCIILFAFAKISTHPIY